MGTKASSSKIHQSQALTSSKLISSSEYENSSKQEPDPQSLDPTHTSCLQSVPILFDFLPDEVFGDLPQELSESDL